MDAAQHLLSQPQFSPLNFQIFILKGIDSARKQMKALGPTPPEATQLNRRIFEFLDAVTQKRQVNTREEAVKLLGEIDAWETKQANPKVKERVLRKGEREKKEEEERVMVNREVDVERQREERNRRAERRAERMEGRERTG
jgi:hypothetical protein